MTLEQREYEKFLGNVGIDAKDVARFHFAWGVRNSKGDWIGKILIELTKGRGPRGGKKGRHRFALLDCDTRGTRALWNTKLDSGWRTHLYLEGDVVVLEPNPPLPPDRRAAIASMKAKRRARESAAELGISQSSGDSAA
jgi:hypothetical protein